MVRVSCIILVSLFFLGAAPLQVQAGPDMSRYTPVLIEEFDRPLSRFDGTTGIWRDYPRRQKYIGNGPPSLYVNPTMTRQDGSPLGLDPFKVEGGKLHIAAAPIPAADLHDVQALLRQAGYKEKAVQTVRYYTGSLSTFSSWSQTYGYFEMRAKLPEGKGHWSAFWLVPSVNGWPPEIDIFEVLGRENGSKGRGSPDNRVHLRVHFDEIAADGSHAPELTLFNPFEIVEGAPQPAIRRERDRGPRFTFAKTVDVEAAFERQIFDEFNTYALSWTPDEIVWWFGSSSNDLREIYRAPTPRDVTGPMAVIFNNQIGGKWAGAPDPDKDAHTFASTFVIDYVKIYAQSPETKIETDEAIIFGSNADEHLAGSAASQAFHPKGGFDILSGGGGADRFVIAGDSGSKVITDFTTDDVLVLTGWTFNTSADALSRLEQVGPDLWLIDEQEPHAPQTLIFRDLNRADMTAANFDFRPRG
ncbi:family 16 glycosylhydrolase [Roseovarius phycicola]|uniref:Family 16 glycosylhydrolase n=1 Tax=Roseovarius phycicola TaxID=3080976 RepID=A0ABZ2HL57_9RHOB